MTRRRLKITPVLVTLNVLVLLLIVSFYLTRMFKYYIKENGNKNSNDTTVYLVDTILKKQSYVDLTKGLVYDEDKKEYRYIGEVSDNYLEYSGIIYRIVSIDSENNIKLVSDNNVTLLYSGLEKGFSNSYVYKWLNYDKNVKYSGVYESNIKESVNYLTNSTYCDDVVDDVTSISCDKLESSGKISLLSLYDYYKAGGKKSYLNNGDTFYLNTLNSNSNNYYITSDGEVSINEVSSKTYGVRPVISLGSGTILLEGKGTKDNPYKIYNDDVKNLADVTINKYVNFSNQTFKVIDNSGENTKLALNGVIKNEVNDNDEVIEENLLIKFASSSNKYSNSSNTVGKYLNTTYLNTLEKEYVVKSNWYIGSLSLDNLDYSASMGSKVSLNVGMINHGDMFLNDIKNVFTISRGIESNQIINVINNDGNFYGDFVYNKYNVRPVIYLKNDMNIISGDGTVDSPYMLGDNNEKGEE